MSILSRLSQLLGSPEGSFVYHLLLLLAVEAALAMAWGEWRRAPDEPARRWLVALAGLAGMRILYVGAAILAAAQLVSGVILPPLERLVDTASICFLGSVLIRPGAARARARGLLLAALLALFAGGVVLLLLWQRELAVSPGLAYTLFWQSDVWSACQIGLSALVTVAFFSSSSAIRGESRVPLAAVLGPMLFLFLGGLLQILLPGLSSSTPVWERLSNLVAYPLIAAAVYQGIVVNLRLGAGQLQEISQASLDQIKSLLLLVDEARNVSASLSLPQVLENAVRGVARALDADQCAIALLEETEPSYVRLASVYNAQASRPVAPRGEAVTFPLDYQFAIQQAMRRQKSASINEPDNVQLRVLFNLLGSSEAGPLLIQPILMDGEAIGAILVGNSLTRRAFTLSEAKLCQSMADQLSVALQNAHRYLDAQERIRELHRLLGDQRRRPGELPAQLGREGRGIGDLPLPQFSAWEDEPEPSAPDLRPFRASRTGRGGQMEGAKLRGTPPGRPGSAGQGVTGS